MRGRLIRLTGVLVGAGDCITYVNTTDTLSVHKLLSMEWKLERATEEDKDILYQLLLKSFFKQEPATKHLFTTYGPPLPSQCLSLRGLPQNLSFKAVVAGVGPVGAALNLNSETLPPSPEPLDKEPHKSLVPFFEYIESQSNGDEKDWLTLQVLTVDTDWRRRGIADALVARTEEEAVLKGYRGTRVVCTSAYTAGLVAKRGWELLKRIPYRECPGGKGVFEPGAPHTDVNVYVKRNPQYITKTNET